MLVPWCAAVQPGGQTREVMVGFPWEVDVRNTPLPSDGGPGFSVFPGMALTLTCKEQYIGTDSAQIAIEIHPHEPVTEENVVWEPCVKRRFFKRG